MRHTTLYVPLAALLLAPPALALEEVEARPEAPTPELKEVTSPTSTEVPPQVDSETPAVEPAAVTLGAAEPDEISMRAGRFKGSLFIFDESVTVDTLDKHSVLSRVPSYQWWLSLRPRYYILPDLSVRMRLDLTTEWLNAVDTTRLREPLFGDIWLDLAYNPPQLWGIRPTVSARVILPTSKDAIAESSVMKVGPVVSLVRSFNGVKVGDLKIGDFEVTAAGYALFHLVQYTSPGVYSGYVCTSTDFTNTSCSANLAPMNSRVSLVGSLGAKYSPIEGLTLDASYTQLDSWAYDTPTAMLSDPQAGRTNVARFDDTRFRQSGWFSAGIEYTPVAWVSLSVGYYCLRPVLDQDGSYGNPFYYPGGNTRAFFTTTFNLDAAYDKVGHRFEPSPAAVAD